MSDSSNDTDDHIEWHVNLSNLSFGTTIDANPDVNGSAVEEQATEELIKALKNGDVRPRWNLVSRTPEQRERHAAMDEWLRCERCKNVTRQEKQEITIDDEIAYVCLSCVDELKDVCNECGRTRDEFDEGERMEIKLGGRNLSEYLCSTCYGER